MSMSTHVLGFKPPDDKWKRMKDVRDACIAAKIPVPKEVDQFFGWTTPTDAGVEVDLEKTDCVRSYEGCSGGGFDVDVKLLPKDVTIIRFYNSW